MTEELARDSQGRYAYNPEYFGKTGTPYSQDDHDYLVEWYDKISLEEMAFALERTPTWKRMDCYTLTKHQHQSH